MSATAIVEAFNRVDGGKLTAVSRLYTHACAAVRSSTDPQVRLGKFYLLLASDSGAHDALLDWAMHAYLGQVVRDMAGAAGDQGSSANLSVVVPGGDASPSAFRKDAAAAGDHSLSDIHPMAVAGSPRLKPGAALKAAAAGAVTVLDTFRLRDGRPIGDVAAGELKRIKGANLYEAAVIDGVLRHAANAAPLAKVRDLIKAADLDRILQQAAEESAHA